MDTATLTVPTDVAQEALADYKRLPPEERTAEDRAIIKAYEAIARGQDVISLADTIRAAGHFEDGPYKGMPRMAISRAHESVVYVGSSGSDLVYQSTDRWWSGRTTKLVTDTMVRVRNGKTSQGYFNRTGTAVPAIPAKYRPKPHRLHLFHILWEVEAWDIVPPGDPALLRHLAGDMWAVLAQWDLTPIERAAMERGRLR